MNGKGDKYRVRWSKEYEFNFNKIFKKDSEQCQNLEKDQKNV
jgi:hypothetical protein